MNKIFYQLLSGLLLFIGIVLIFISASINKDNFNAHSAVNSPINTDYTNDLFILDPPIISVNFQKDDFLLTPPQIQNISSKIHSFNKDNHFIILDGYADSTGSKSSLLAVSRSYSVYECLVNQGIPQKSIFIRTIGDSKQRKVDISIVEVTHL